MVTVEEVEDAFWSNYRRASGLKGNIKGTFKVENSTGFVAHDTPEIFPEDKVDQQNSKFNIIFVSFPAFVLS